jgi:DNA polymerase III delta prime subunit
MGLQASQEGKEKIKKAREDKGWTYDSYEWLEAASKLVPQGISEGTLKRFQAAKKPINAKAFRAYCHVLGLDWEEIVENKFEDGWVGRSEILTTLINQLQNSHRLILLTGITGIGKTALAEKLASELQNHYPELQKICLDDSEQLISLSSVATEIISNSKVISTLPPERSSPENLLQWLLNYICTQKVILIIDSLESVLEGDEKTGWSNFKDIWWIKFFEALCSAPSSEGRLILTSQEMPVELQDILINHNDVCFNAAIHGLNDGERLDFFEKAGLDFEINTEIANYLHRIGKAYEGHPLALKTIAGEIMSHPFYEDIIAYWQEYKDEIEAIEKAYQELDLESSTDKLKLDSYSQKLRKIVKEKIEKTFKRLEQDVPNAYRLLCFSSVYRRPVPKRYWLKYLTIYGLNRAEQEIAFDALIDRYLVEMSNNDLRQHNLIRSTALEHLKNLNK